MGNNKQAWYIVKLTNSLHSKDNGGSTSNAKHLAILESKRQRPLKHLQNVKYLIRVVDFQ